MLLAKTLFQFLLLNEYQVFKHFEGNFHACKQFQKIPKGKDENDAESISAKKFQVGLKDFPAVDLWIKFLFQFYPKKDWSTPKCT